MRELILRLAHDGAMHSSLENALRVVCHSVADGKISCQRLAAVRHVVSAALRALGARSCPGAYAPALLGAPTIVRFFNMTDLATPATIEADNRVPNWIERELDPT